MDIVALGLWTSNGPVDYGPIVNNINSIMWIERYRDAGEFEIVADADSDILHQLFLGSYITHTRTPDIMVVENIEITEEKGKESEVKFSGSSLASILDYRVSGSNINYPATGPYLDFIIEATVEAQVKALINAYLIDPMYSNDDIPNLVVKETVNSGTPPSTLIDTSPESIYKLVMDNLAFKDLGIRAIRGGSYWDSDPLTKDDIKFEIHDGNETQVNFYQEAGDIESSEYFWSIKGYKNKLFLVGKWIRTIVPQGYISQIHYSRKYDILDVSDIDGSFESAPVGTDYTNALEKMKQRGYAELSTRKPKSLMKVVISKESNLKYREDYDIGDIVKVHGKYGTEEMRVTEHVEILDKNGFEAYPVLSALTEEGVL